MINVERIHRDSLRWRSQGAPRPAVHPARALASLLVALLSSLLHACRDPARAEHDGLAPPTPSYALSGRALAKPIDIELDTDAGIVHCVLEPERAPRAVSLFVGLSTGRARWLDPKSRTVTERPLYRDLPFTRAIPAVFIQSGDVVGDGSGTPGYRIAVEPHPSDRERLARPGALVLARYTVAEGRKDPNPPPPGHVLGSQFAVLLTDMSHLAGQVSVLGRCRDLEIAQAISEDVGHHRISRRLRTIRVR